MKTWCHDASSCLRENAPPHSGISHLSMASAVAKGELSNARKTAIYRGDGVALWRKIEQVLAAGIALLPPDDRRLPSEQELGRRFGVNRHTGAEIGTGLVRAEPAPRGARARHVRAGAAYHLPCQLRDQVQRQAGRTGLGTDPADPRNDDRPGLQACG